MGNFVRDLAMSKEAVNAIMDILRERGHNVKELPKERQKEGDIEVDEDRTIEVKFDMYAKRSGNLCFEMSNGKKPTGIMTTQADDVYYVVPNGVGKYVYTFDTEKLREYIQKPENVIMKNGGDKRKFSLALVPIEKILKDELPESVFKIGDSDA